VYALSRVSVDKASVIPILLAAAQSEDKGLRMQAIEALGDLGTNAQSAVVDVRGYMEDLDPDVRDVATNAVAQIMGIRDHHVRIDPISSRIREIRGDDY